MSQQWIPPMQKEVPLPDSQRAVIEALADQANAGGVVRASIASLVQATGLSDRQVRRILNELKRSDLITVRYRRGGRGQHSIYGLRGQSTTTAQGLGGIDFDE